MNKKDVHETPQITYGNNDSINVPKKKNYFIGKLVGALFIFLFGWSVGSGRITIPLSNDMSPQNSTLPANLNYATVEQVYDNLKNNYDGKLNEQVLLDGLKNGLAEATGDPYTEYLNEKQAKDFRNDLEGTFSGIGAELGKEESSIVVVAPIADYPAAKAGIQAKDIIIAIDNKPTTNMTLSEAVNSIRGPAGSQVTLKVLRDGQEKEFIITRANITIDSVKSEVKDGIGYMTISTFAEDTPRLARQVAEKFKQQQVKGVVVDVRGNPGGLLDSAVDISSLWLTKNSTVLTEKRGGKVVKSYNATGQDILRGVPTVVLIDESSASASEILAGALQDNNVATVIGVNSYGKGSVQNLVQLPDGGVLKVTIARWYTPEGQNIDKSGITPDQKVDRTIEDVKAGKDPQKDAATRKLQ